MKPKTTIKTGITGLIASGLLLAGGIVAENGTVITMQPSKAETSTIKFADAPTVEVSVDRGGVSSGVVKLRTETNEYTIRPASLQFEGGKEKKDRPILLTGDTLQDKSETKFAEVFGLGSEMYIVFGQNQLRKIVKLDSSVLNKVPATAKYIEITFDIAGSWSIPDGIYNNRLKLNDSENVWLEKSLAWDSNMAGDPNQNYTDIEISIVGNTLTKRIPIEWLQNAQFPVYTDAVFTFGTKQFLDSGPSGTVDVVQIGDDKFVTCWHDNGDGTDEVECQVSQVTGTTVATGTTVVANADAVGGNNGAMGACDAGNDRWVVVYVNDAASDDIFARVASSTGTTINGFGASSTIHDSIGSNSGSAACTYVSTDKIIIGYYSSDDLDHKVVACTISVSYELSCGTSVIMYDNTFSGGQDTSCTKLDTDKFICQYLSGGAEIRMTAGTVSGTTITLGTTTLVTPIGTGQAQGLGHQLISPNTDKFVTTWSRSTTIGNPPQIVALGTVSGTTITLGATTTVLTQATSSFTSLTAVDADSAFWMGQIGTTDAGGTVLGAIPIELDFGSLTYTSSTAETIDTTTDPGSLHAALIGTCKFAFVWEDDNDTNDLFSIIGDLVSCASSVTDSGIIWFD